MPLKTNEREYRRMTMAAGEDDFTVRGYATTFDAPYTLYQDRDLILNEVIDRNALNEADMDDVILQYDHAGRVFARTSNNTLEIVPDDHGLAITADLGGTDLGRGLFQEIKGGYTTKMSWAFTVAEDKYEQVRAEDGRTVETRTITKIRKVYDVSAVSLPANDATEISARTLADGVIERLAAERQRKEEFERRKKELEDRLK